MDTDISHAVEERLTAIEARLDALEGNTVDNTLPEPDGDLEPVPVEEEEV